jgi:hypothetical protein
LGITRVPQILFRFGVRTQGPHRDGYTPGADPQTAQRARASHGPPSPRSTGRVPLRRSATARACDRAWRG